MDWALFYSASIEYASTFQTAEIQFVDSDRLPVKVDLSFSSVSLPQFADGFTAQVFVRDQAPILILNTEHSILTLVSGIRTDL